MNHEKVVKNIRRELEEYVVNNGLKSLVLGISGGIDSCLVAVLAKPVCDKLNIPLIGRSIPIESNKEDEIERAILVGREFCTDFKEIDKNNVFKAMIHDIAEYDETILGDSVQSKIRRGNIKARIRMIELYDVAKRNQGFVLSTDNYSEELLNFWTVNGDVGDYSPIQKIWKTEVFDLANYIATSEDENISLMGECVIMKCIDATPTDGLGITDSDMDQICCESYYEVDKILKTWLVEDEDSFQWDEFLKYEGRIDNWDEFVEYRDSLINHPVVIRYENGFKQDLPICPSRELYGIDD